MSSFPSWWRLRWRRPGHTCFVGWTAGKLQHCHNFTHARPPPDLSGDPPKKTNKCSLTLLKGKRVHPAIAGIGSSSYSCCFFSRVSTSLKKSVCKSFLSALAGKISNTRSDFRHLEGPSQIEATRILLTQIPRYQIMGLNRSDHRYTCRDPKINNSLTGSQFSMVCHQRSPSSQARTWQKRASKSERFSSLISFQNWGACFFCEHDPKNYSIMFYLAIKVWAQKNFKLQLLPPQPASAGMPSSLPYHQLASSGRTVSFGATTNHATICYLPHISRHQLLQNAVEVVVFVRSQCIGTHVHYSTGNPINVVDTAEDQRTLWSISKAGP